MKKKRNEQDNGGNLITNYTYKKPRFSSNKPDQFKFNQTKQQKQQINDYHQSSKQMCDQSSKTQILNSDNQHKMQQQKQLQKSCLQMIMIAPLDTTYYRAFKKKIQNLLTKFNKDQLIKIIRQNARFSGGVTNLNNLEKIEDHQFWSQTILVMLKNVIQQKKQKMISSKIQMLLPKSNQSISLSKAQIYMILLSMFFCIFPQQSNKPKNGYINFSQLMTIDTRDSQSSSSVKLEKLKCIINYFKQITKRKFKDLQRVQIQIQRTASSITQSQFEDVQYNLCQVDVMVDKIQQRYKYDLMIDFANKKIGGGVLNRGAVQEEILFVTFPQLIATICFSYQMYKNEAIIVYNAQRFNLYEGYSDTFKFVGSFHEDQKNTGPFKSVIVAVDATDFKYEQISESQQYTELYIYKQLIKFLTGIQGADYNADQCMNVCTGKWGCGAFGGDIYLKFLIQWIACSISNRRMIFMCNSQELTQLTVMVKFLRKYSTLQLLEAIKQYEQYFDPEYLTQISFLQFIKKYM